MIKTRQMPLRNVLLLGGPQQVMLSNATLLLHQDYISDGLGGQLPGMRSWKILASSGIPFQLLMTGEQLTFESDKLSGKCFATNDTTLQGTGPIAGLP